MKALLALEDGSLFEGRSFTGEGEAVAEVCFNTSMAGYQEVLTDPSYRLQMVAMTYPLIGIYGVNEEDMQSDRVQVEAFIVKEYQPAYSNWRAQGSLGDFLKKYDVLGVEGIDTRRLTRLLRIHGSMKGVLSTDVADPQALVSKARDWAGLVGVDAVAQVCCQEAYRFEAGWPGPPVDPGLGPRAWQGGRRFRVVAFDYGIKYAILRCLERMGAEIIVLPAGAGVEAVNSLQPDGVFLSNGPGDPEPLEHCIRTVRGLIGRYPIFGICLGQQLLGLALGGRTYKLKFGHRGANQPVKNLLSGRVEITAQNHGFCVDLKTLDPGEVEATHLNLNDNTLEGFRHKRLPLYCVQYHPENSPGPHDAFYLFDQFAELMDRERK